MCILVVVINRVKVKLSSLGQSALCLQGRKWNPCSGWSITWKPGSWGQPNSLDLSIKRLQKWYPLKTLWKGLKFVLINIFSYIRSKLINKNVFFFNKKKISFWFIFHSSSCHSLLNKKIDQFIFFLFRISNHPFLFINLFNLFIMPSFLIITQHVIYFFSMVLFRQFFLNFPIHVLFTFLLTSFPDYPSFTALHLLRNVASNYTSMKLLN